MNLARVNKLIYFREIKIGCSFNWFCSGQANMLQTECTLTSWPGWWLLCYFLFFPQESSIVTTLPKTERSVAVCFFYCVSRVFKAINSSRATCVNICMRPSGLFLHYHCFILISNKTDLASFLFCLNFLKCIITGVLKSVFLSCKIYSSMVPLVEHVQSLSANPIVIDLPSSSSACRQRPWEVPRSEPCRRAVSGVAGTEKWLPLLLCEVRKVNTALLVWQCSLKQKLKFFSC